MLESVVFVLIFASLFLPSGQLGGAVVELQPSLPDGALGMEVASANLSCLLGIRVPGPPQPPGSPVGVQRAPLAPPELLA